MNVTHDTLAAADRFITRREPDQDARAVIREALGLACYVGADIGGRGPGRGRRADAIRTPDDILGATSIPAAPGNRAIPSGRAS